MAVRHGVRSVAVAVVRDESPQVFLAEDIDVLHWVLALEWVARADPASLDVGLRDRLRLALREERWADAVVAYMDHLGTAVDVYDTERVHLVESVEMAPDEIQFRPLFRDGP